MNLVHSIPEACTLACTGRTAIYEAIKSGELIAHKRGKRTLFLLAIYGDGSNSLPQIEVKHPLVREPISDTPQVKNRAPAARKGHS